MGPSVLRLSINQPDFDRQFDKLVNGRREAEADVSAIVEQTIRDVRARGDVALLELTERFDGFSLSEQGWQISADECKAAYKSLAPELQDALKLAAQRIKAYHKAQLPKDRDYQDKQGVRLGARWGAVDAAGVYVPRATPLWEVTAETVEDAEAILRAWFDGEDVTVINIAAAK